MIGSGADHGPRPGAGAYHGPHVVLTVPEIKRVLGWAHADRLPDDVVTAIRRKAEAALNTDQRLRTPL